MLPPVQNCFHTDALGMRMHPLPWGSVLSLAYNEVDSKSPLSGGFSFEIPSPFRELTSGGYTVRKGI